jgi:hypothetical protein
LRGLFQYLDKNCEFSPKTSQSFDLYSSSDIKKLLAKRYNGLVDIFRVNCLSKSDRQHFYFLKHDGKFLIQNCNGLRDVDKNGGMSIDEFVEKFHPCTATTFLKSGYKYQVDTLQ